MSKMPTLFIIKSIASGNHKLVKGDWLEITRQVLFKMSTHQVRCVVYIYIYTKKKKRKTEKFE